MIIILKPRTQIIRNFSFISFILFLTCSIAATSALADINLVINTGFEIGVTVPMNWTFIAQNGLIPVWDNVSYSGSKSVKISISGRRNKVSGYPRSDLISVSPLTNYTVSAWGKTQNAGGINTPAARVVELDVNKNWIRQTNLPVFSRGTNDWTQKTTEFQTGPKTKYLYIYANIWKGYGTFWLDDVELRLKNTPTFLPNPTPTPKPSGQDVIDWSGLRWDVRTGTGGPGTNNWTRENVWVDSKNRLHLKITNVNGKWYCAELSSQIPVGFGTYTFNVYSDPRAYANNVVGGLFYYLSDKDEIDIEFSRWNVANTPNTQYTVWGHRGGTESPRYETKAQNTTHKFVWNPSFIEFQSVGIGTWKHNGYIPKPGGALIINLWLFKNPAPMDGKEQELILTSVQYVPSGVS